MAATLKALFLKDKLEKDDSNFDSASGNVAMAFFETRDRSMQWCVLVSDTSVTTAHFKNFDDGENLPVGTMLIDASGGGLVYFLLTEDTWSEAGDVT